MSSERSETGDRQPATGNVKLNRGDDIAARLLAFAVAALRLARQLPKDFGSRHIAGQWIRSATSAGANYEEARAAESRADFVHKLSVAAKEIREARYWLELIVEITMRPADLRGLLDEGRQLAAVLGASVKTARGRTGPSAR